MPVPNYTPRDRPSILIVDDYADAREVLSILLKNAGFDVITAATGPEALAAALAEIPSIVLMDLGLPGMSGTDVARQLRARGDMTDVRLVAVTGCSDPAELEIARMAGFDSILIKPCAPPMLIDEINRLLEQADHSEVRRA